MEMAPTVACDKSVVVVVNVSRGLLTPNMILFSCATTFRLAPRTFPAGFRARFSGGLATKMMSRDTNVTS
jgi:hypothetical protein